MRAHFPEQRLVIEPRNAFVFVQQHARGEGGGGGVIKISSDREDLMRAKTEHNKIPRPPKKTPKKSQDQN